MDKWKKAIIKEIYKQWIKTNGVSAQNIVEWLKLPETNFEIYDGVLKCLYDSWYFKYYIRFLYGFRKLIGLEK